MFMYICMSIVHIPLHVFSVDRRIEIHRAKYIYRQIHRIFQKNRYVWCKNNYVK